MSTRRQSRSEPRVLAIEATVSSLAFVVADPWEVRAAGVVALRRPNAIYATVRRLIQRERPSLVATRDRTLGTAVATVAGRLGRSIAVGGFPKLATATAIDMYPELALHAPTPRLVRLGTVAISATLSTPPAPRLYAKSLRRLSTLRTA